MINHIVLFKIKEKFKGVQKEEVLNLLKANLENLKHKIPEIIFFEAGIDIIQSQNSYDICLNSKFKSLEDLEKYRVHPEHQKIIELINANCDKRIAIDYNI